MQPFNLLQTLCQVLGLLVSAISQTKLKISKQPPTSEFGVCSDRTDESFETVPLGDSITEITCWRTLLWDSLAARGVTDKIQFAGSMEDNLGLCVSTAAWDQHHEGHSGYLAVDIANNNLAGWLGSAKPDVVMFMLGTNDITHGYSTTEILAAYTQMVQEMRASNPSMRIIVRGLSIQQMYAIFLTSTSGRPCHSSSVQQRRSHSLEHSHSSLGPVPKFHCLSDLHRRHQHRLYGWRFNGWCSPKL